MQKDGTTGRLTWGLCIATLNRIDVLEVSVGLALEQSRPPSEIVICDASDDFERNRSRIAARAARHPGVRLVHLPAPARSTAVQRNHAVQNASADVVFLIDDDSFLYPDCAEEVMRVYESDPGERIAAVGIRPAESPPTQVAGHIARNGGNADDARQKLTRAIFDRPLMRSIGRSLLMMDARHRFVPYDPPGTHHGRREFDALAPSDVVLGSLLFGCYTTVRRRIALLEPYENALLAYSPGEDVDASFRFGRHGLVVHSLKGRLYHFGAAASRIKRRNAIALMTGNLAYFVRTRAASPSRRAPAFAWFVLRSAFASLIKDVASRRFDLPSFRGVLDAIPIAAGIFRHPDAGLADWYKAQQRRILERTQAVLVAGAAFMKLDIFS